jgi:predicted membrane channel-forming protein YqfA (hemolysin III family)
MVLDDKGNVSPYHSTTRKVFGWPGMMMGKVALISFRTQGIPSLGTMVILVGWVGVMVFATLWHDLPLLGLEGIAYRLP